MDAARNVWGKRAAEQAAEQDFVSIACRNGSLEFEAQIRNLILRCICGVVWNFSTRSLVQALACVAELKSGRLCADACWMLQQDAKKGQPWQRFDRDRDLQAGTY